MARHEHLRDFLSSIALLTRRGRWLLLLMYTATLTRLLTAGSDAVCATFA